MPEPLPDRVARASDRSAASASRAAWPSPRRSHLPLPHRRPTASPPKSNAAAGHKSRSPIQLSSTTAGSTAGSAERHHQPPQHKAAFAGCVPPQRLRILSARPPPARRPEDSRPPFEPLRSSQPRNSDGENSDLKRSSCVGSDQPSSESRPEWVACRRSAIAAEPTMPATTRNAWR